MTPTEGIDILGVAIEHALIKLMAPNAGTFIAGAVFGFLAGRKGEGRDGRKRAGNTGRGGSGDKGRKRNTGIRTGSGGFGNSKNVYHAENGKHNPRDRKICV